MSKKASAAARAAVRRPPPSRTAATIAAAASAANGSWPDPARTSERSGAIKKANQSSRFAGA
jgi:hypothetical protein